MNFDQEDSAKIYKKISAGELKPGELCEAGENLLQVLEFFSRHGNFHRIMQHLSLCENYEGLINGVLKHCTKELLASLATDKMTPASVLEMLEKDASETVRSHAQLNLLGRTLDAGLSEAGLMALISEYAGDDGISIGVRQLIASSRNTPLNILKVLEADEVDCIAMVARQNVPTAG